MFSIMTIASSTTKPVAMVSAISERLFRLKPARYITPKVPTRESGTARLGITVARRLPRKRKITSTTSTTASTSSKFTSRTDARMVLVRSVSTVTWIAAGSELSSWGRSAFTRSTTSMTLAPGWRWMLTTTAGVRFIQAASLGFSAPSSTSATSERRTGAPLR